MEISNIKNVPQCWLYLHKCNLSPTCLSAKYFVRVFLTDISYLYSISVSKREKMGADLAAIALQREQF